VTSVDPFLFLGVVAVLLVVMVVLGLASRRRRDAALAPTRLGPSWVPAVGEGVDEDEAQRPDLDHRVRELAEQTGVDRGSVEVVLGIWREYLAVLGLGQVPATHRYRLYDPYNPPLATRDAEGRPAPDRQRVARDIGSRTEVTERDAELVLAAAQHHQGSDASS
jgi:hypothetical protein